MRAGEPEFLHGPAQLQRVLDVEDRKGMMRARRIARGRNHQGAGRPHGEA
jgi:hypothetical protein